MQFCNFLIINKYILSFSYSASYYNRYLYECWKIIKQKTKHINIFHNSRVKKFQIIHIIFDHKYIFRFRRLLEDLLKPFMTRRMKSPKTIHFSVIPYRNLKKQSKSCFQPFLQILMCNSILTVFMVAPTFASCKDNHDEVSEKKIKECKKF